MTKVEAVREFKENYLPEVMARYGKKDKPAIREAWGVYTDSLCKSGQITLKQYETWDNPF